MPFLFMVSMKASRLLKLLENTLPLVALRYGFSQPNPSGIFLAISESTKFMDPALRVASSGLNSDTGASLSSSVMS